MGESDWRLRGQERDLAGATFRQAAYRAPPAGPFDRVRAEASLFHDLGVDGADGCEFMEAFGARFNVDMAAFDAALHFGPEAGGNPFVWLWWDLTRSWPRMVPITIADLALAAHSSRWATPDRPARPAS